MTKIAPYPKMMTRTAFCPKCAAAGRPKKETAYVTYGSDRDIFILMLHIGADRPPLGMTPHLFRDPHDFYGEDGKHIVIVNRICHVNGCGLALIPKRPGEVDLVVRMSDEYELMTPEAFLGLMEFKDRELQLGCVNNIDDWSLYEIAVAAR